MKKILSPSKSLSVFHAFLFFSVSFHLFCVAPLPLLDIGQAGVPLILRTTSRSGARTLPSGHSSAVTSSILRPWISAGSPLGNDASSTSHAAFTKCGKWWPTARHGLGYGLNHYGCWKVLLEIDLYICWDTLSLQLRGRAPPWIWALLIPVRSSTRGPPNLRTKLARRVPSK